MIVLCCVYNASILCLRVSGLRSLLQVQRECDASVCAVQSGLQKRWALLEELHTRVTLRPDSTQEAHDPHTVLTDTEVMHSCHIKSYSGTLWWMFTDIYLCVCFLESVQWARSVQKQSPTVPDTAGNQYKPFTGQYTHRLYSHFWTNFTSFRNSCQYGSLHAFKPE